MLSDIALIESRRRHSVGDSVIHASRGIGEFTGYVDGHVGLAMVKFHNRDRPVACWLVDLEPSRAETNFDRVKRHVK